MDDIFNPEEFQNRCLLRSRPAIKCFEQTIIVSMGVMFGCVQNIGMLNGIYASRNFHVARQPD